MPTSAIEELKSEFAALVKPHEAVLFPAAMRFANNRADAEDLLQETYMRAYVGFKKNQAIDNPRAWLFKIMRNAYINRYHKERRRPNTASYEEGLDHKISELRASASENPEEVFFSQFFDSEIEEALGSIPEQFREAVILCDVSGLTYEEISHVLECPLGTVRSRISRGRELLFGKLYEYAKERGLLARHEKGIRR